MSLILLEAYPFDSNEPTEYDDYGYPIFDRAVTSRTLAACFKQFFTDGIFAAPANNLRITRGSGFNINIGKGIGIIEGHMGGVFLDDGLEITLTDQARGTNTYSVFLRYDNNDEYRSLFIRVEETNGTVPSEPETAPLVKEYRLGYITIPSNVTDLTTATIVDERGTEVCPYVTPFVEIDLASVVSETQYQASLQLQALQEFIETNKELIESIFDGSAITNLQNQINSLQAQMNKALTDDQFLYYCGLIDTPPVGWQSDWQTYAQEKAGA